MTEQTPKPSRSNAWGTTLAALLLLLSTGCNTPRDACRGAFQGCRDLDMEVIRKHSYGSDEQIQWVEANVECLNAWGRLRQTIEKKFGSKILAELDNLLIKPREVFRMFYGPDGIDDATVEISGDEAIVRINAAEQVRIPPELKDNEGIWKKALGKVELSYRCKRIDGRWKVDITELFTKLDVEGTRKKLLDGCMEEPAIAKGKHSKEAQEWLRRAINPIRVRRILMGNFTSFTNPVNSLTADIEQGKVKAGSVEIKLRMIILTKKDERDGLASEIESIEDYARKGSVWAYAKLPGYFGESLYLSLKYRAERAKFMKEHPWLLFKDGKLTWREVDGTKKQLSVDELRELLRSRKYFKRPYDRRHVYFEGKSDETTKELANSVTKTAWKNGAVLMTYSQPEETNWEHTTVLWSGDGNEGYCQFVTRIEGEKDGAERWDVLMRVKNETSDKLHVVARGVVLELDRSPLHEGEWVATIQTREYKDRLGPYWFMYRLFDYVNFPLVIRPSSEKAEDNKDIYGDFNGDLLCRLAEKSGDYLTLARISLASKHWKQTIAHCTKALEKKDANDWACSSAHTLRGRAYQSMGQVDKALADYNKALTFWSENEEAFRAKKELEKKKATSQPSEITP